MEYKNMIEEFSIFSGIADRFPSDILQHVKVLKLDSGEIVFKEGADADFLYGVIRGNVELAIVVEEENLEADIQYEEYTRTRTETVERNIVVDSIVKGEIFGWSALTPAGCFTSMAVTAKPSVVFALPADKLRDYFSAHPEQGYIFMQRLAEIITQRLANRTSKLIEGWIQAFQVDRI